jgi:hypothetical protein
LAQAEREARLAARQRSGPHDQEESAGADELSSNGEVSGAAEPAATDSTSNEE